MRHTQVDDDGLLHDLAAFIRHGRLDACKHPHP